jgi:hypothetical protein
MRKLMVVWVSVLCWAAQAQAGDQAGKVIRETWDAAYLGGGKAGHVRTSIREINKAGQILHQTKMEYRLKVKRFQETLQLGMDIGDEATVTGQVTGVFMRQYLGSDTKVDLRGEVVGKQLILSLAGGKKLEPAPWDKAVVGLAGQQMLFHDKEVQPGDTFSYRAFDPSINLVVTIRVKVVGHEMIEPLPGKAKEKLLRVDTQADPIEGVKLPGVIYWLDDQRQPVRMQTVLPVGQLTLYRTTKGIATENSGEPLADIALSQLIRLNRKIVNPHATRTAVYRIKIRDEDNPSAILASDLRQSIHHVKKDSFELTVKTGPSGAVEKAGDEFIQSSYFINCDDALVKKLAKTAVGSEKDPWKKALRIEKWVNRNMKSSNEEGLDPADQVAKTLRGDCSEYAMLMAAMCRAQGVPSRTAMGLIYADLKGKGPVFSFHMWTEVWVDGQWLPLDATLGRGAIGATHIKITDHSWHETRSLTPLLPIYRVLGKVTVEVLRVEY